MTGNEPETGTKPLCERDMLKLRRVPKVCTMRLLGKDLTITPKFVYISQNNLYQYATTLPVLV
jgi:hypothetical protein